MSKDEQIDLFFSLISADIENTTQYIDMIIEKFNGRSSNDVEDDLKEVYNSARMKLATLKHVQEVANICFQ